MDSIVDRRRGHAGPRMQRALALLSLVSLAFSPWRPAATHAQIELTTDTLVSEPGDLVIGPTGGRHDAVLTYGHSGCTGVDNNGFCTGGLWPTLPGAHWIWNRRLVSATEAVYGTPWLTFEKSFTIPMSATNVTGQIQLTADNVYELYLNGLPIGGDGNVSKIDTYGLAPRNGSNTLLIRVFGLPANPTFTPATNPAGLIYSAQISYVPTS